MSHEPTDTGTMQDHEVLAALVEKHGLKGVVSMLEDLSEANTDREANSHNVPEAKRWSERADALRVCRTDLDAVE